VPGAEDQDEGHERERLESDREPEDHKVEQHAYTSGAPPAGVRGRAYAQVRSLNIMREE
jgi:hypothetical protein